MTARPVCPWCLGDLQPAGHIDYYCPACGPVPFQLAGNFDDGDDND